MKKINSQEFKKICILTINKSKSKFKEITLYSIKLILKSDYGFKELEPNSSFNFQEEII